ncbi:hypothetical protein N7520_010995 [Penicillium odoratum]|uniref:uncharacterized protein n=1 Tax=Penicillium odoratum TaxID=1167516 RepID=UPI0025470AC0|nr:uncharacterized protein N7520_010995 [Penicillium odoratum]KAJ5745813.1 hypothetical protein N7520_010995 [Penicillium odoratum]
MDWLKRIFTGKDSARLATEKKNKRVRKAHQKQVLAREDELRHLAEGGGAKQARLFVGSQGRRYSHERDGKRTDKA